MTTTEFSHLEKNKILILGDLLIDKTYYVEASKISPEAPILACNLLPNGNIETPGGAGLAASYAAKNKINSLFLSMIDPTNDPILYKKNIKYINLQPQKNVSKIRYIDKTSGYQLIRIDNDDLVLAENKIDHELLYEKIKEILISDSSIKVLSLLDYKKGFFSSAFNAALISLCKELSVKVYTDTKGSILSFNGIDTLKLNKKEYLAAIAALNINSPIELIQSLNLQKLIITKGSEGASVFTNTETYDQKSERFTGIPDVTGCGDVFDVNFCFYYYIKNFKLQESLMASVYAASKYAHSPIETRL